jgi:hypothetical protein
MNTYDVLLLAKEDYSFAGTMGSFSSLKEALTAVRDRFGIRMDSVPVELCEGGLMIYPGEKIVKVLKRAIIAA